MKMGRLHDNDTNLNFLILKIQILKHTYLNCEYQHPNYRGCLASVLIGNAGRTRQSKSKSSARLQN